jgi:hypothetical protein
MLDFVACDILTRPGRSRTLAVVAAAFFKSGCCVCWLSVFLISRGFLSLLLCWSLFSVVFVYLLLCWHTCASACVGAMLPFCIFRVCCGYLTFFAIVVVALLMLGWCLSVAGCKRLLRGFTLNVIMCCCLWTRVYVDFDLWWTSCQLKPNNHDNNDNKDSNNSMTKRNSKENNNTENDNNNDNHKTRGTSLNANRNKHLRNGSCCQWWPTRKQQQNKEQTTNNKPPTPQPPPNTKTRRLCFWPNCLRCQNVQTEGQLLAVSRKQLESFFTGY